LFVHRRLALVEAALTGHMAFTIFQICKLRTAL
jgi:hypothetical protein